MPTPFYQDEHCTIYCGDCREILPTLNRGSVRLLWTDPPYGHSNQDGDLQSSRVGVRGARQRPAVAIQNDSPEEMRTVVSDALTLSVPLLTTECCCCCCCGGGGPRPTFAWVADRMDRDGLSFFHAVVWDKTGRGHGLGWRFRRDYEMVMVAHRSDGRLSWREGVPATSNLVYVAPEDNALHPTQKPAALVGHFIELTTSPGELILDPFMGSGTTLEAAKLAGRRAIGIEIDERFAEIAAERLRQKVLF
jgi:hypothetical protein